MRVTFVNDSSVADASGQIFRMNFGFEIMRVGIWQVLEQGSSRGAMMATLSEATPPWILRFSQADSKH